MPDVQAIDSTQHYNCFSAVVETGSRMQIWIPSSSGEYCPTQTLLDPSGRLEKNCNYC